MDEARRFIRYVFPGLASLSLFVLFCALSQRERLVKLVAGATGDADASIGAAIAVFVASGAIGYLVSVAHHLLYWSLYKKTPKLGLFPDLRSAITDAIARGQLILVDQKTGKRIRDATANQLSMEGAWILMNSIWHFAKGTDKGLESAEQRAQSLFDIMHGAGALFAGSLAALVAWLLCEPEWTFRTVQVLMLAVSLSALLAYNLRLTAGLGPAVTRMILSNYLAQRHWSVHEPLAVVTEQRVFERVA